jgi:hypothetical protein
MKKLKKYTLFETSRLVDDIEDYVGDILIELEDIGFQIEISRSRKDVKDKEDEIYLEIRIMRPWGSPSRVIPNAPVPPGGKYPGDVFIWREVKDSIIRLNDWYYSYSDNEYSPGINSKIYSELSKIGIKYDSNSPFRMFHGGVEFGIGWSNPEDFDNLGDLISFTSLRIIIRV